MIFIVRIALVLFVCSLLPWWSVPACALERVRLTNGEWPPYMSARLPHYGLVSHIVTRAFALEGVPVDYGFFPWMRSMELARTTSWDGSVVWLRTSERERIFLFSDTVSFTRQAFFYRKDKPFDWCVLDDLQGLKIGSTLGCSHGEDFDRMAENGELSVDYVATDRMNLKKLLSGRIDVFPVNVEIGYYLLRSCFGKKEADNITHHPCLLLKHKPLHLIVPQGRPRSEIVLEVFNRGLKALRESGEYDLLVKRWRDGDFLKGETDN